MVCISIGTKLCCNFFLVLSQFDLFSVCHLEFFSYLTIWSFITIGFLDFCCILMFFLLFELTIFWVLSQGEQGTAGLAQTQVESNKFTRFLETGAVFPYCNWSIKIARVIWFGSTSVDMGPAYVN